jgi:CRP/FNR family cyclic AMP-dependent transcriptional regulator
MREDSVFGEPALFVPEKLRVVDAIAMISSTVVAIPSDVLVPCVLHHPRTMLRLVEGLAAEARSAAVIMSELAFDHLRERLARRLVLLADQSGERTARGLQLEFGQADLARFVSATRENVNRALQSMAEEGLLELGHGRMVVLQLNELRRRGDQGWPPIWRKNESHLSRTA